MTGRPGGHWVAELWPAIDLDRHHIRTPDGNIVPFAVIGITLSALALIVGLEGTFGITNWVSIPAALAALTWAAYQIDEASIAHRWEPDPCPPDGGEPPEA